MSLFIFQNGTLYADRRKIVNFHDGPMITSIDESKVHVTDWCYFASSGYEISEKQLVTNLRWITVLECIDELGEVVSKIDYNAGLQLKYIKALTKFQKLVLEAEESSNKREDNYLVIAKKRTYLARSTGKIRTIDCVSHDKVQCVGSASHAAKIMLMNGVPPKNIYPVLRRGGVPVGAVPEEFHLKDLKDLAPPWTDMRVWLHVLYSAEQHIPALAKEDAVEITNLLYSIATYGSTKREADVNDYSEKEIVRELNQWEDKSRREHNGWKEIFSAFNNGVTP